MVLFYVILALFIGRGTPVILTGKVVKSELQTVRPGIDLVICYVQVDEVIKGVPHFVTTDVLGKRVETVAFGCEVGSSVPGLYWFHNITDDGLWFMSALPSTSAPGLPHRVDGMYFDVIWKSRASVAAVKDLLRQPDKPNIPALAVPDAR